jgi:hypothetical protein
MFSFEKINEVSLHLNRIGSKVDSTVLVKVGHPMSALTATATTGKQSELKAKRNQGKRKRFRMFLKLENVFIFNKKEHDTNVCIIYSY